jgi:CubicO group peptidase (beta-lactamase class C family)
MKLNKGKIILRIAIYLVLNACTTDPRIGISQNVENAVRQAVDSGNRIGIVLGQYRDGNTSIFGYGVTSAGNDQLPNGDTVFALGSITKVFTAESLAALEHAAIVTRDTMVSEIWPAKLANSTITLGQLATHTAGFPRDLSQNILISNNEDILLSEVHTEIGRFSGESNGQGEMSYSNLGMALLGRALVTASGYEQPDLINRYITTPLGMNRTGYDFISDGNVAKPHRNGIDISESRTSTPMIAFGSGGLYSTARDLLAYLKAYIEPNTVSINTANTLMREGGQAYPLGWQVHNRGSNEILYHSGDGNGYQAFIGFRPATKVAVVLLTNSSEEDDLLQIALHMLDTSIPLPSFSNSYKDAIPSQLLDFYIGNYRLASEGVDGNIISIENLDGQLIYVETSPQGTMVRRLPMKMQKAHNFYVEGLPVRIVFSEPPSEDVYMIFNNEEYLLLRSE